MSLTDCEKARKKRITFCDIYIFLYLVILVFCSKSEGITNHGVIVPFFQISKDIFLLPVLILGFLYVFFLKKRVKFDNILLLLFGRILLCLIPAVLNEMPSNYTADFVVSCFPFLLYLFFLNCDVDLKKATNMFIGFGLAIAIQCVWAYLAIRQNDYATYNDLFYKNYFVIPIGATNNISAVLLPLTVLGDQTIKSRKFRVTYVAFMLLSLFLCKSRTGLLLAALYLLLKIFIKERGKHSVFKKVLICFLPMICVIAIMLLKDTALWNSVYDLFLGFSHSGDGLDELMSGRLSLYENVLEHVDEHIVFGNGVNYEKIGFIGTHNAFLEMLYENGIVGALGFAGFLFVSIRRVIKSKTMNKFYYAFYVAMPFVLINAMVEDTLFVEFMLLFGLLYLADMEKARRR